MGDEGPLQASAVRVYIGDELEKVTACDPGGTDCESGVVEVSRKGEYRLEVDYAGETYQTQFTVDEIEPVDQCCNGGYSGFHTFAVDTVICAELDAESCAQSSSCVTLDAFPGGVCVDYSQAEPFGCGEALAACGDALTYAAEPGGDCALFPTTCLPDGWEPCDEPIPEACER